MTKYPGYDTQFYVVLQQVVTGPIVGLEDLSTYNIEPDTPVWYDGLDDWKPAILAPLTNQLFTPDSEYHLYKAAQEAGESIPEIPQSSAAEQPVEESVPEIPVEPTPVLPQNEVPHATNIRTDPFYYNQPGHQTAPQAVERSQGVKRPSPYLIWSIVVAVVFSLICGIIAIIYSCKVKSKFKRGDIKGAERCSETAQWWIAIGICVGLISSVFQLFVGSLLPFG